MRGIIFRKYDPFKDAITLNRYLFTAVSLLELKEDDKFFIDDPDKYVRFVVEDCNDSSFIGTITLIIDGSSATIHSVVVREDYQRKGIATLMFQKLFEFSEMQGIRRLNVSTWSSNQKAISFYKKMGFRINKSVIDEVTTKNQKEEISFSFLIDEQII
ncbi:MAG: GNAT family N-acetyltransferase [Candidatus Hodarchaeales archaeon]